MIRKTFLFFILTIIVLLFTTFDVMGTHAQVRAALLTANRVITPQPIRMPYEQQKLFESQQKLNNTFSTITASSSPIRGVLGDWWADAVIGQPNFAQITPNQVVGNKIFNPGGVYVDRSTIPNRLYVYDAGNSRILGFSSLGACVAGTKIGQSCTSNSDCPSSACAINSTKSADLILGQLSSSESTCNGDSGFQTYPNLPAPNANTLCGLRPESISILEGGSFATMTSDSQGNLYHPDYFNNRIVRYNNPFSNDSTADYVWGQPDFTHGECNAGRSYGAPDNKSLCLAAPMRVGSTKAGVAVDSAGNLWVADTQNNRVLRFPYNSALGAPAQVADLVLGQINFSTTISGNGLNQMNNPGSVRVDSSGKVYVLDGLDGWGNHGRLLVFVPPLSNSMAASQVFAGLGEPTGLELDPDGGLWVNNTEKNQVLRLTNGQLQTAIGGTPSLWGGFGIDRDRNLLLSGWDPQAVAIYSAPSFIWTSTFLQADEYGSFNQLGPRGMTDPGGLEVTDNQLIVADQSRLLFWNNPALLTNNYPAADGIIGQPDFFTRPRWDPRYGRMRADTHGRLWVLQGDNGLGTHILAYQLPLVSQAEPVIQIASPLPLKNGGSFSWSNFLDLGGIAYQPECDCLWLSDTAYSRVFRINQISSPNRVVDIILGQGSATGMHCNEGRDSDDGYIHPQLPSQDSLCHPGGLSVDQQGNLFVSDHNLEIAGNWRLLEYDATGLPLNPATAIFGLPASRVYGRNGSFTEPNCQNGDPMCGAWEPVFYPNNEMVIGFNTYLGPAFPQVYHDPLTNSLPYTSLRDFYSHAYSARLDSLNNLYVLDLTRNHVLIYKAIRYYVSGNVGVSGATLSYTEGTPKTVIADSNGNYSISVPVGWSGTVTPSKQDYTFAPANRAYSNIQSDQVGQNYTAQAHLGGADTTGVFRPSNGLLYLKNSNTTGFADIAINYGLGGDYPVVGDWDGDGDATIGVYRNGSFYLRNSNTVGFADIVFPFGTPGDQPVAGAWDGDGVDTIGVYRNGTFFLRNSNSTGVAEMSFVLGNPGDVGIAGDWNGDGLDTTGVFRPSNGALYLKNTNATGFADVQINYGLPGDKPLTGDWDDDGIDTIGIYRNGTFYLRNTNTIGFADIVFALGNPGDMPIAGNWDGKP